MDVTHDTIPIAAPRCWCWPAVCVLALLLGAAIVANWQAVRASRATAAECEAARAAVAKVVTSCAELAGAENAQCTGLVDALGRCATAARRPCPPPAAPKAKIPEFKIEDF